MRIRGEYKNKRGVAGHHFQVHAFLALFGGRHGCQSVAPRLGSLFGPPRCEIVIVKGEYSCC
jgi:hypothetical protein